MSDDSDELDLQRLQDRCAVLTGQRDRARALLRRLAPNAATVASWWLSDGDPNETSAVRAAEDIEAMGDEIEAVLSEVDVS